MVLYPIGDYNPTSDFLFSGNPTSDLLGQIGNLALRLTYSPTIMKTTQSQIRVSWAQQKDQQEFQASLAYFQEKLREESQTRLARLQSQLHLDELAESHQYRIAEQRYQAKVEEKLAQINHNLTIARQKDQQNLTRVFQWELSQFRREMERELALFQSQLAIKQRLVLSVYEKLTTQLRVNPFSTIQSHQQRLSDGKTIPLTVLISPPAIRADRVETDRAAVELKQVEDQLLQRNREFLQQHYPLSSKIRPVEHLGGAWRTRDYYGEAGVKDLQTVFQAIPTLFLESAVSGEQLNFNFAFWFPNHSEVTYQTVFSTDYIDLLCHFAKVKAVEWLPIRKKLLEAGRTEEEITQRNPVAESNLEAMKREEEDQSIGINLPSKAYGYQFTEATEYFSHFLAVCHQIIIALMADVYHLLYSLPETEGEIVKPSLPQLLPDLLAQLPQKSASSMIPELIQAILQNYRHAYEVLGEELQSWIPELTLDLASSFSSLEDKSWSAQEGKSSLRQWLQQKGVTVPESAEPSLILERLVSLNDPSQYSSRLEQEIRQFCQQKGVILPEKARTLISNADLPYLEKFGAFLKQLGIKEILVWKPSYSFDQLLNLVRNLHPSEEPQAEPESPSTPSPFPNPKSYEFEVITVDPQGRENSRFTMQAEGYAENLGNEVFLEMVYIPDGNFLMGGERDEEKPHHRVAVPEFYMGIYPVTQAQWRAVAFLPRVEIDLDPNPSHFKGDNLPVEKVNWYDAKEFLNRLSRHTGREYRLPSEAEWEYACRARSKEPFYFGPTITTNLANYNGNCVYCDGPKGQYRQKTTPVGSFSLNSFGLYDLHGNVWEWCLDDWHDSYEGAPTDGTPWLEENHPRKILRGGSWNNDPTYCRSGSRNYHSPDNADGKDGFRVVCGAARSF